MQFLISKSLTCPCNCSSESRDVFVSHKLYPCISRIQISNQYIFGWEYDQFKHRKFILVDGLHFSHVYFTLHPKLRKFYEVLTTNHAMNFYLDIERPITETTPRINMDNEVFSICNKAFTWLFQHQYEPQSLFLLESSRKEKISFHLIIVLAKPFRYVPQVKKAVQDFFNTCKELHMYRDGNLEHSIIDLTVYNNNQQFRILGSHKVCNPTPFTIRRCTTNQSLDVHSPCTTYCTVCSSILHHSFVSLPLSHTATTIDIFIQISNDQINKSNSNLPQSANISTKLLSTLTGDPFKRFQDEHKTTLYRHVWSSILMTAQKYTCTTSKIKLYNIIERPTVVIFNLSGYHYCPILHRHHKSNNVHAIFNFKKHKFQFICRDPACNNGRSTFYPVL